MRKTEKLSPKEQKEIEKKKSLLRENPDDAMAASRIGYLLHKSGRGEKAAAYLLQAFNNFVRAGQYSLAVMVADELLSVRGGQVEILHTLSQIADRKDIRIPILEIYGRYKDFHQLPLFEALDKVEFLQLLKSSRYHEVKENKVIIKEGDRGEDIYLIVEGKVGVSRKLRGKKKIRVASLGRGDFMGEIAYMSDKKRSATIRSDTPCQLLSWRANAIGQLNEKYPQVTKVLYGAFWERSLDTVLSLTPLFSHLEQDQREKIIGRFKLKTYTAEKSVLKEGERNPEGALFIIKKGEAVVFKKDGSDFKHPLAVLKTGDVFGEYSAVFNEHCTATVMSKTYLEVITLQRSDFLEIIKKDSRTIKALEEIRQDRLDKSLLHMSYFQFIE